MPRLALGLWFVYVAVAFALRMWLQLRAVGNTGFVSLQRLTGTRERIAGGLVAAALVTSFASVVLALLWPDLWCWSVWKLGSSSLLIGALAYAAGVALTFTAQLTMGESWRIGVDTSERTELVAGGLFRWVRNPIFSAMCLTGVGLLLIAPSYLTTLANLTLWLALELQVRGVEEPYLVRTHGDVYRQYAARTGRFLPWIGRGTSID